MFGRVIRAMLVVAALAVAVVWVDSYRIRDRQWAAERSAGGMDAQQNSWRRGFDTPQGWARSYHPPDHPLLGERCSVHVSAIKGVFHTRLSSYVGRTPTPPQTNWEFAGLQVTRARVAICGTMTDREALWHRTRQPVDITVTLPLWHSVVLLLAYPVLRVVRDRTRRRARRARGLCIACGYDLTGNTRGRCPECGGPA